MEVSLVRVSVPAQTKDWALGSTLRQYFNTDILREPLWIGFGGNKILLTHIGDAL